MRSTVISGTTIEYPDVIGFAFNPCVINIYGAQWDSIVMSVKDKVTAEEHTEEREMFGSQCFFDLKEYVQGCFDTVDFGALSYNDGVEDTNVGHLFDISVSLYKNSAMSNSFAFTTFFVWGAMEIGERYNGERSVTWFKNFPFTVGIYSAVANTVKRRVDGTDAKDITISGQGVWNIPVVGLDAENLLVMSMSSVDASPSTFDNTFDLTFKSVGGDACVVNCFVNDSDEGVYLRWMDRKGMYQYWLFENGDESRKVSDDGEFLRNNMMDYSSVNGYHGGTGRKQRKIGTKTIPICSPLVDQETYDFLFDLCMSPVVDMYLGKDDDGNYRWQSVNVNVGTFSKSRKVLQDFIAQVVLPEIKVQSL